MANGDHNPLREEVNGLKQTQKHHDPSWLLINELWECGAQNKRWYVILSYYQKNGWMTDFGFCEKEKIIRKKFK
jgi:hypothetical protein